MNPGDVETNNPQAHQPAVLPPQPAQPNTFGLPQLAPASGSIQLPPGVLTHDPQLASLAYDSEAKLVMDRAMAAARDATTRKARHLLRVEVAAKQLVLSMLEYEEFAQGEAHLQGQAQRLSQAQAHAQGAVRQVSEGGGVPDATMDGGEEEAP